MQCASPLGRGHDLLGWDPGKKPDVQCPILVGGMGGCPYCPLHAHHPASADDLAILTDCPHCFDGILETDFEAIGNLCVWIWVCRVAELLKVFHCNAIFIWRV